MISVPGLTISDEDGGFVDVAANALAMMILVTMLILTISAVPAGRGIVIAQDPPDFPFPVEIDPFLNPTNSYHVVTGSGVVTLDLDAVAQVLVQESVTDMVFPEGRFYFKNDLSNYRDLTEYELQWLPDFNKLAADAQPLDDAGRAEQVEGFTASWEGGNVVPTFFVTQDGWEVFAALHGALRATPTPLRWRTLPPRGVQTFLRDVDQFETSLQEWR